MDVFPPRRIFTVSLLACFLLLAPARPDEVILRQGLDGYSGAADNSIYANEAFNTNGGHDFLYAGVTNIDGSNSIRRALLRFDLADRLPAGAVIQSVRLTLHVDRSNDSSEPYTLHRLTRGWGEGAVDSGDPGGQGFPADPGDATWTFARFEEQSWTREGGDFLADASATTLVGLDGTDAVFDAPALAADVHAWLADPSQNFGWILRGNEDEFANAKRFVSADALSPQSPTLAITFSLPRNSARHWLLYC